MNKIAHLKQCIEAIIVKSSVPEDPIHSKDTLRWLLKLDPAADQALQIAALGHDIERAIDSQKIRREDFTDYDDFKAAHAFNSATILKKIMLECGVENPSMVKRVFALVLRHETGGDPGSDLLKDADSLSYFSVNLPFYYERNGWEESLRRCRWGYRRLSARRKPLLAELRFKDDKINALLGICLEGRELDFRASRPE